MHYGLDFRTKKSLHQFNRESMQGFNLNEMVNINDYIAIRTGTMLFDGFGIELGCFGELHLIKTKRTMRIDINFIGVN
jgi:hypothetical protein